MIIDLQKFVRDEQPYWDELEGMTRKLEGRAGHSMRLPEARRYYYLYERASADLARFRTFCSDPDLRSYLELLVSRTYAQIQDSRATRGRLRPLRWFFWTLPQTFRSHAGAFYLSTAITLAGCIFGALALGIDDDAKRLLLPEQYGLGGDPTEHVRRAEEHSKEGLEGRATAFSFYVANNTKVSFMAMALGMTWGIGTILVLFKNGVLLGAVSFDFVRAGQGEYLVGWLLPHGSFEIPAILVAGQAGLVLAKAVIGWSGRATLRQRMRQVGPDLVTLIFGVAILLGWAAVVEAFFSQYHEPVLPYWLKISFGCLELVLLIAFLALSGRGKAPEPEAAQ